MNKSYHNSLILIFEKIFSLAVGLIVTSIVARYFGPDEYGLLNQSLAIVTLFSALSLLGMDHILVKKIVNNDSKVDESDIVYNSLLLRLVGGVSMLAILSLFIFLFNGTIIKNIEITYIFIFMYIFKSFEVYEYWFHSKQKMFSVTIIRIFCYSISAIFKLGVVYFESSLFIFTFAYLIDPVIYSILIYWRFKRTINENKKMKTNRFNRFVFKDLFNESRPLLVSGLLIGIYSKIDLVMLGILSSNADEVGYYAAALQISSMWYFIPFAIVTANKSLIMQKNGFESVVKVLEYLIILGVLAGIFINLTSEHIILILFGQEFFNAVMPLNILAWVGFFATIGTLRSIFFVSTGSAKINLLFTFLVVITNIILNLIFIPKFDSVGAALASLLSQFLSLIVFPLILKKSRDFLLAITMAMSFKHLIAYFVGKRGGKN